MEVSQGEVPLYIPGRIILLHQRMEESENVIWTFWSHINPHSPLHIAPKSLVKPPFQYVDVFKLKSRMPKPISRNNATNNVGEAHPEFSLIFNIV